MIHRLLFRGFFLGLVLFQLQVLGAEGGLNNQIGKVEVPADKDVIFLLTTTETSQQSLPIQLSVISWNVHKGADTDKWAADMKTLSAKSHIFALQEAMHDKFMPGALSELSGFSFWMAESFFYNDGRGTGVSTGCRSFPRSLDFNRSPGREPVINTPKLTLLSTYMLSDGKPLLVANLHGINFVMNSELQHQLTKLKPIFEKWTGRILFLGDFNTWNPGRTTLVKEFANEIGFTEVAFAKDSRHLVLDHIFVKGCKILDSKVLDQIKTSDHSPLWASIDCQ